MLKQLISLFAEKFLQSKRESIQDWTYPKAHSNSIVNLSSAVTAGQEFTYVPPENGILQVVIRETSSNGIKVNFKGGGAQELPREEHFSINSWPVCTFAVKKGNSVKFSCTAFNSESNLFFIPYL